MIAGGEDNEARGGWCAVGGGLYNIAFGLEATVGGGYGNTASNNYATVGGGFGNWATGDTSTVAGGEANDAMGDWSVVGGGSNNMASALCSFVGGGAQNTNFGKYAAVVAGQNNTVEGDHAFVFGGQNNTAGGNFASIVGGFENKAVSPYGVVLGGYRSEAGEDSLAAGNYAIATNKGAFVWSGYYSALVPTESTNDHSFTVRAPGGVRFITSTATNLGSISPVLGVYLAPGTTTWAALSDSNAKTAVTPVDARGVLHKLASLPVTRWQYKGQPQRSYIGPMAQDFHAAFGLGDDKTISTLDSDGVIYAAIQGLVEELKERDKAIEELEKKSAGMEALKAKLQALEERLDSFSPAKASLR